MNFQTKPHKTMTIHPKNFVIKLKTETLEWLEDFEQTREQILNSDDPKKLNYSPKRFNIDEQEEITVIYLKGEIVAFSSLFCRSNYPRCVSRILNRLWKSPKIRYVHKPYWLIARYMLFPQLKQAKKLNKSAVFISVEGNRSQWLKRFTLEAKKENDQWEMLSEMYQVVPKNNSSCWQNIAFLPLKKDYKLSFPKISRTEWEQKFIGDSSFN